ncbi:DUF427 domain-containing protein [Rhizobium etli]|uniref:DUF427 domain-containing protein n=1 Tax=Rhizobium etli TaxID=29449 RepID=UPI001FDA30DC|nr:DUF427 domain-containing protein [Rhizobium sp. IE4771]
MAALALKKASYSPVRYIPRADVDMSLLECTEHQTYCPYKGTAPLFHPIGRQGRRKYEAPLPAMIADQGIRCLLPGSS